jgi:hypothetical protein
LNGGILISLASINQKLLAIFSLETYENKLLNIEARDMKILPFNASHYDESNEL